MKKGNQKKLKVLANLDRADREAIADLKEQIELRQIERAALYEGGGIKTSPDKLLTDTPSMFESLLHKFTTSYNYPGAADDVLLCRQCDPPSEPDDPVLADCGHIYCMECFTHMLYENRKATDIPSIPCLAFGGDQIRDCLVLDSAQWEAIQTAIGGHKQFPYTTKASSSRSMREKEQEYLAAPSSAPWSSRFTTLTRHDDVTKLWHSLNWHQAPTDESPSEADSQDDDMDLDVDYLTDTSEDPMDENPRENSGYTTDGSDDGFDDDDRSEGYRESSFIDDAPQDEPDTADESNQGEEVSFDEKNDEHVYFKLEEEEVVALSTQGLECLNAQGIMSEGEAQEGEEKTRLDDSFEGFSPAIKTEEVVEATFESRHVMTSGGV